MAKKIKCSTCGKYADELDLFCGKCGSDLPKENWDRREQIDSSSSQPVDSTKITNDYPATSDASVTVMVPKTEYRRRKKWYNPPKRSRPAYHPAEWFFYIGWALYVILRFIGTETYYYCSWMCCWRPPRELKESGRKRRRRK